MIRFIRSEAGPVIWISWTTGSGSGSGGPSCAVALNEVGTAARSAPSSPVAASAAIFRLIGSPHAEKRRRSREIRLWIGLAVDDLVTGHDGTEGARRQPGQDRVDESAVGHRDQRARH